MSSSVAESDRPRRWLSRPRVVVELRGGLGNQMFQYAVGRSIAMKHGRSLVLDDMALRADHPGRTKRTYALDIFQLDVALTSDSGLPVSVLDGVILQRRRGFHGQVLEPCALPSMYLKGFWQHPGYFSAIEDRIRRDFRLRHGAAADSPYRPLVERAANVVGIHVRRTDYLTPAGATLGFVGPEYYAKAVAAMRRRVRDRHFLVFSDDLGWCRRHLSLQDPHTFVEHEGSPEGRLEADFGLMTLCRHFIIANSSFSWWAAWLGAVSDNVVVAPRAWFRDAPADSRDIVPAGWLRL
jgi:hypothetical protein